MTHYSFDIGSFQTQTVRLQFEVIAQRDFLAGLGCDRAQGFFLGKPVDADAASAGYV